MVVVVVIGILAAMAVPIMGRARIDRRQFNDASDIAQLVREARTRALSRGGAVLIEMASSGTANLGTFRMYDAVRLNVDGTKLPSANCKTPQVWDATLPVPLAAPKPSDRETLVQYLDFNSGPEISAGITSTILIPGSGGAMMEASKVFLCLTPLGRIYMSTGSSPSFDAVQPMVSPVNVVVSRKESGEFVGINRIAVIPSSGATHVASAPPQCKANTDCNPGGADGPLQCFAQAGACVAPLAGP